MPFNIYFDKVHDFKNVCIDADGNMSRETQGISWSLMNAGISAITEENWEKVYRRLNICEKVLGPSMYDVVDGKPVDRYISPDDVMRHIGLRTNSSPKTDAVFRKEVFEWLEDESERKLQSHLKMLTEA